MDQPVRYAYILCQCQPFEQVPEQDEFYYVTLFAVLKTSFSDKIYHFFRNCDRKTLKKQNGRVFTYCINMYGIIHQTEKG